MNVDFSQEILALEVDKIYFKNTKKEYSKQAEDDYKVLSIDFTKVPMISPFKNSSIETKKELEKVSALQNQWNPSKELLMRCDDDPDGVVFNFYDKVNPPIKSKDINIKDLMSDLNIFIIKMKMHFNRARPFQVSDYHNIEIYYNKKMQKTGTAATPSYPSGHTAAAYFAAEIASHYKPQLKKEFLNLANIVALSRIEEGVHFPSDNEYAIKLVKEVLMPAYLRTVK